MGHGSNFCFQSAHPPFAGGLSDNPVHTEAGATVCGLNELIDGGRHANHPNCMVCRVFCTVLAARLLMLGALITPTSSFKHDTAST
jgi:hypothetical protein